ncbi:MAG: hypothetical protein GX275_01840 [Clostridiales bacterium]|nr:hypothetical protein [Clostridiales bacterium]
MEQTTNKASRELISTNIHITLSLGDIVVLPNSDGKLWNPKQLANGEHSEEQGFIVVGQTYSYFDGTYINEFQMEFKDETPRMIVDEKGKPLPLYKTMVIPMVYSQFKAKKYKPYQKYLPFPAHIVSRLTFNKELSNRQLQNSKYIYFKDGKPIYEVKTIVPFISLEEYNKINGTFLEGEETPIPSPPTKGVSIDNALSSLGLDIDEE